LLEDPDLFMAVAQRVVQLKRGHPIEPSESGELRLPDGLGESSMTGNPERFREMVESIADELRQFASGEVAVSPRLVIEAVKPVSGSEEDEGEFELPEEAPEWLRDRFGEDGWVARGKDGNVYVAMKKLNELWVKADGQKLANPDQVTWFLFKDQEEYKRHTTQEVLGQKASMKFLLVDDAIRGVALKLREGRVRLVSPEITFTQDGLRVFLEQLLRTEVDGRRYGFEDLPLDENQSIETQVRGWIVEGRGLGGVLNGQESNVIKKAFLGEYETDRQIFKGFGLKNMGEAGDLRRSALEKILRALVAREG